MSVVAEGAIRRVAKEARQARLARITPDDATHDSREHAAHRPAANANGIGVLSALAQAGIRLSQAQRSAIARLSRRHPELLSHPFTPNTAVEHLITLGVPFSDSQLELVSDECTVSGFRRIQSAFEDSRTRTTASHPAFKPRPTTQTIPRVELEAEVEADVETGFFAWVRRLF
jgi:hypothetical protein